MTAVEITPQADTVGYSHVTDFDTPGYRKSSRSYTQQYEEHLSNLDAEARERVLKKLGEARNWTDHRLDRLSGWPYYKLRAGDYRAIITWDKEADRLVVAAVGHRRNVYDRHLPP
jgi:mRNA interferase RelE/StbE